MRLSRSTARRRDSGASTVPSASADLSARSLGAFTDSLDSLSPFNAFPFAGRGSGRRPYWATRDREAFNGHRDYYSELGYPEILQYRDHYHLFRRGGIARRLVLAYPLAIWENGVHLIEDEDPNITTPFEQAADDLEHRLHWRKVFLQADTLARIGKYSCILIGVRDRTKSEMSSPLPKLSGPDDVIFLRPLSEVSARIAEYDIDPTSDRYGQPTLYIVSVNPDILDRSADGGITNPTDSESQSVHWSRMIHITRGSLENPVYGIPILEAVWNLFFDKLKNTGGGSEAYWRNMYPPTVYNLDPEVSFKNPDAESAAKREMQDQITQLEHSLRRSLVTRGVTPTQLHSVLAPFSANVSTIMDEICGTLGIPQRIAMGSERGQLASGQDEKNWRTRVNEERELEAVPNVADFIARLQGVGALPFTDQYMTSWPVSDDLTEVDRSESAFKIARANLFMSQAGAGLIQTPAEIRENLWEMGPLDDKDAYPVDPNVPDTPPPVSNVSVPAPDDPTVMSDGTCTREARFMSSLSLDEPLPYPVLPTSRVVILGGPRSGKSSLASRYQAAGMPVYCGDPKSLVKDIADNVNYLPENLSWSEGSQYIADHWLSLPGPWVCEGVSMARALRKLMHSKPELARDLQVVYLRGYQVEPTPGQVTMSKGIATVWGEISSHFVNSVTIDTGNEQVNVAATAARKQSSPLKTKSERKCGTKRVLSVPVKSRDYLVFTRI